jgi:DNA-binding MarR family transcriptional regulator
MDEQELLKLDNQLCFTIYACSREISRLYRPLLDELGITYPQYLVLLVLWEKQASTVKELGEQLYLDSGTLTPMLKRMEAAGLIIRQRSSEDERKVVIQLTEEGHSLRKKAACIPKFLLTQSEISKEEFARLLNQFKKLLERVHQLNEKA